VCGISSEPGPSQTFEYADRRRPARAELLRGDPCGTRATASFADSEIPSPHARNMKPFILASLPATKEEILAALPKGTWDCTVPIPTDTISISGNTILPETPQCAKCAKLPVRHNVQNMQNHLYIRTMQEQPETQISFRSTPRRLLLTPRCSLRSSSRAKEHR
jgi:hypothetical protein